jgi:hypothetical protein
MATPLIPQEIFLLERYSSLDFFGRMRDEFAAMLRVGDEALAAFMLHLPPDYRSRPLFDQPDAVWGERVLPNLRWTLAGLNDGFTQISHGDLDGSSVACNVRTAFTGMRRDYTIDWMPLAAQAKWDHHERGCDMPAFNIEITAQGEWNQGDLTSDFQEETRGPLDAPASWPLYRINPLVRVKSGAAVPKSGVYLPDVDAYSAQFLIKDYEAWEADIKTPQSIESAERNFVPTTWTLVERVANSGGGTPGSADPLKSGIRLRCEARKPCPVAGYWFTPARLHSRRAFRAGEVMPDVGGDYGITIWQWDEAQS